MEAIIIPYYLLGYCLILHYTAVSITPDSRHLNNPLCIPKYLERTAYQSGKWCTAADSHALDYFLRLPAVMDRVYTSTLNQYRLDT